MRLKLECLEGPRKGDQFTIREEVTVGRRAELSLRDKKASSTHARIFLDSEGLPAVEDLSSANGTKLNGKKIEAPTTLHEGDIIGIGGTLLKVLEIGKAHLAGETESSNDSWAATIEKLLLKSQTARKKTGSPKAFFPPIEISVKQGLQAGQSWVIGFGPRKFGRWGADFILHDDAAPDLAFELIPQDNGGAQLRPSGDEKVLVNKQSGSAFSLQTGDQISVGNIILSVEFLKNI